MRKMPSLFVREYADDNTFVSVERITPSCEWVAAGEGVATRKYDGTCCLVKDGEIYRRFDAKPGRQIPAGAIPCQDDPDEITGHWPHWVKCDADNPGDKWHIKALAAAVAKPADGTYELCGIHFQNNVDNLVEDGDVLVRHGQTVLDVSDRSFNGLKCYLSENYIEGIVFHRGNGDMCKVKRSDFGLPWGVGKTRDK